MLSLLQTQVHKHAATTVVEEPADFVDPENKNFPGYNFHDFSQTLCSKYGEHFPQLNKSVVLKCPTKVIPSNVEIFNKDLQAYGGCASGLPYSWSWKAKVDQGHGNGVGRGDSFTAGDAEATTKAAEACRLGAEKDVRCAGANLYVVWPHFCECYGGVVAIQPNDKGYYRWPAAHLSCGLKSLPSIQNPMEQKPGDGAAEEVYTIKETQSFQGCSKGWYSANGGGHGAYDAGRPPLCRTETGPCDGGMQLPSILNERRPSDCVNKILSIKKNDPGTTSHDYNKCHDSVGAIMLPAGSSGVGKPQAQCGCLKPGFDISDYRPTGTAEYGSTGGGSGSWMCLLDDGDATKGESFLPTPKKSGIYKPDGPSPEKEPLSPEVKAKCKADRKSLKEIKKAKKEAKAAFIEAKEAFKALQAEARQLKAEMVDC